MNTSKNIAAQRKIQVPTLRHLNEILLSNTSTWAEHVEALKDASKYHISKSFGFALLRKLLSVVHSFQYPWLTYVDRWAGGSVLDQFMFSFSETSRPLDVLYYRFELCDFSFDIETELTALMASLKQFFLNYKSQLPVLLKALESLVADPDLFSAMRSDADRLQLGPNLSSLQGRTFTFTAGDLVFFEEV
jgi:hypothetical protein